MENGPLHPLGAPTPLPSPKAQSWGAIISIIVIVLMIVIGAFYAWGTRTAQMRQNALPDVSDTSSQ